MKNKVQLLVIVLTALLILSHCVDNTLIVDTMQGKVGGILVSEHMRAFLGIPYAYPPVKELRFGVTEPLPDEAMWEGVREAASYGLMCIQPSLSANLTSEDCLNLNIWTPKNASNLPVMFWIHGGGFVVGSGAWFNGSAMASREVVVVTINYRLGAFGFLADQELLQEYGTTGNYGIYDQLEAFQWVRKNIQNFGGDPSRITIFGESAGGISVSLWLASPLIPDGMFQSAIIQSTGLFYPDSQYTLESAQEVTNEMKKALNCENIECLRSVEASKILQIQRADRYSPTIDGKVLKYQIPEYYRRREMKKVPIIAGMTSNESAFLTCPRFSYNMTFPEMLNILKERYTEDDIGNIFELYEQSQYDKPMDMLNHILSDAMVHCLTRFYARSLNVSYLYTFDYFMQEIYSKCEKVTHSSELSFEFPFILNYLKPGYTFNTEEQLLSDEIINYWTSFAKTSNPNSPRSTTEWTRYNQASDEDMRLAVPRVNLRSGYYEKVCTFWDNLLHLH